MFVNRKTNITNENKKFSHSLFIIVLCFIASIHTISAQSEKDFNILMLEAAKNNQLDSVRYWLNKGADINSTDSLHQNALHLAILNSPTNYTETFLFLLDSGINPNETNINGMTPLMLAAYNGFTRCCSLLHEYGAKMELTDNNGNTAIDYANANCNYVIVELLKSPKIYSNRKDYLDYFNWSCESEMKNDFQTAIKYSELSRELSETEICRYNLNYSLVRDRLATQYLHIGKDEEAISLLNEVVDICKRNYFELDDSRFFMIYYSALTLLAGTYRAFGDYYKAEPLFREALKISGDFFGPDHPEYVESLSQLGILFLKMEEYKESEYFLKKAYDTSKEFGRTHPLYANSLGVLGTLYYKNEDYERALHLYKESVQVTKEIFGVNHPDYVSSLNNLGHLYFQLKNYSEAEKLFEQALKIGNNFTGNDQIVYSSSLAGLGRLYFEMGNYSKAESLYYRALIINKELAYIEDAHYFSSLCDLGFVNEQLDNYSKTLMLYSDALNELAELTKKRFGFHSKKERDFFWENYRHYSDIVFPSFVFNYRQEYISIPLAYDNAVFSKGLLVKTSQEVQSSILTSGDKSLIETWNNMKVLRKQIIFLEAQPKEKQSKLLELKEEANQLDKQLTHKSQVYRQAQSELQIHWQDIQSELKNEEAAIEFLSFEYFHKEWTDSILYCALVLKKGMEYPMMVPLFEQKQLDSLWLVGKVDANSLYASRSLNRVQKSVTPIGEKLYDLIWRPLDKELENINTVYYSPSGTLHQIAFAALPIDSTNYLCDKYNLVQLSSTRQLATSEWKNNQKKITNATLFGGIKYNLNKNELAELKQSVPVLEEATLPEFVCDSTFRSVSFDFLEGTQKEVDSISASFQSKNISTTLFTGIHGNEESFKSLNNKDVSVLHIATHGFFYPIEKEKPRDFDHMVLSGEQKFLHSPNPLLRSGLIFAGGNRAWMGEEPVVGIEDGILTAHEISEMYLPNTELVVLSACETGLGDIDGGEGVFGLQRAFKLAGAKTIIMSLWEVPDDKTSELMQLFYNKWLTGTNKHIAFRDAQNELRNKYPKIEPKEWAGFVMVD